MKFHELTVSEVRRETAECVSVAFDIPVSLSQQFEFIPGQYVTLKKKIEGEDIRRSYSICSQPGEQLRVAIKKVENGVFSSWANTELSAGQSILVSTPEGNFIHAPLAQNNNSYVAFVAGSGITPVLSIVSTILATEQNSTFSLFYGNRTSQEIIFKEELEALKNKYLGRFQLFHLLSKESTDSPLFSGRINTEKCTTFFKYFLDASSLNKVFLCGPFDMIMMLKETLPKLGVNQDKIKFELFYNPESDENRKETITTLDQERKIRVTLDGLTADVQSRQDIAILDIAIDAGMDLPYSCKGGVCATCKAKLISGKVEMTTNFALEEEEVADGYILACQAHAKTDFVEVSFDV